MLNIGPLELLAIGVVALLVLGPEKLPGAVRTVGRVFGELRRISSGFQNELRDAFEQTELEQQMNERRDRYQQSTPPDLPDQALDHPEAETSDQPEVATPGEPETEASGVRADTEPSATPTATPTATEAAASGNDDDPGNDDPGNDDPGKDDEGASESHREQDDSETPRAGGPAPAGS